MSWLQQIFVKRAEDWTYGRLTPVQVPIDGKNPQSVVPDESYLSITLCSMRVVNVRELTSKFYGVVHSFISLNHLSGDTASFQVVSTPTELKNIDPKRLDRIISSNIPLLGPVPYRGGKISFELGLFSVKESDLAGPYLDLLGNVASKAGISVVSAALPFVETVKKGVDAIIGNSDDAILEIGVSTTYDESLTTGYYVVMRAPKEKNILSSLVVTPDDLRLVDKATNAPFKDYPYIVYKITESKERNDWYTLPYLKEAYAKLQAATRDGRYNDAADLLKVFKQAAYSSNDLLFKDAKRITAAVEQKTNEIMTATQVSVVQRSLPDLETYQIYQ